LLVVVLATTIGLAAVPAQAQSDTTPPNIHSVTVSPTEIDASTSSQNVAVTAVITDDLSGVSTNSNVEVYSPSVNQWSYGFFNLVSGDTYSATIGIPQFSESGIWRDWYFYLEDNVGNLAVVDEFELLVAGISVAFGVAPVEDSAGRTMSFRAGRTRVSGHLDSSLASTCFWYAPITIERRTRSGWKQVGEGLTSFQGGFSLRIRQPGKFRATAPEFAIGTPTVTTCTRVSKTASS
jgi:hypothetical protein